MMTAKETSLTPSGTQKILPYEEDTLVHLRQQIDHKQFENQVFQQDNRLLKQKLQKADLVITQLQQQICHLKTCIQTLEFKQQETQQHIVDLQQHNQFLRQEHEIAMQHAGSLIEEYFQYKFMQQPAAVTMDTAPLPSTQERTSFAEQLAFLESLSNSLQEG